MSSVLAHQGGWDEILMFVVPIVLAYFVIRRLERRGKAEEPDQTEPESQNTMS